MLFHVLASWATVRTKGIEGRLTGSLASRASSLLHPLSSEMTLCTLPSFLHGRRRHAPSYPPDNNLIGSLKGEIVFGW